jgi:CO/xanthine dehydrogenase Mo-binding subunit
VSEAREFKVVGTRVVRPDGVDKVTGRANFGADFSLPGMLFGKVLRSPHAHARIKSIDTKAAAAIEGVYAIVTGADFPKVGHEEITGGEGPATSQTLRLMSWRATRLSITATRSPLSLRRPHRRRGACGDQSRLRSAEAGHGSRHRDGRQRDIDQRKSVHAGLPEKPTKPSNVAAYMEFKRAATSPKVLPMPTSLSKARTARQRCHQGYIEPHACVASINQGGQATIWCCTQPLRRAFDDVESAGARRCRHPRDSERNRRRVRRQDDDLSRTGCDAAVEKVGSSCK